MSSLGMPTMEMNFCRRCGAKLVPQNAHTYACENGHTIYLNAPTGVGIFIITPNKHVLLARRAREPNAGMLDSIGGFTDGGEESFEQTAERELHEELGLNPRDYKPLTYLTSNPGIYPYKGEVIPWVAVFFWTELISDVELKAQDDVSEIVEVPIADIDFSQLHVEGIRFGARALQAAFLKEES